MLDVYGPVQAFASCRVPKHEGGFQRHFEIFCMAQQAGLVASGEGPESYARYGFAEAPVMIFSWFRGGLAPGKR